MGRKRKEVADDAPEIDEADEFAPEADGDFEEFPEPEEDAGKETEGEAEAEAPEAEESEAAEVVDMAGDQKQIDTITKVYIHKRREIANMKADLEWWRELRRDHRFRHVMEMFDNDTAARERKLRTCSPKELEAIQGDLDNRDTFRKVLVNLTLEDQVKDRKAELKKFERDNHAFVYRYIDMPNDQLFGMVETPKADTVIG